jgi:ADP-heptose:LPS heptosyltransferase
MRILIVRIGAFGDVLITTPLIRYLKQQDNEIYFLGSEQAQDILKNNPNIDKFIYHKKDSIENSELGNYFKRIAKENECDKLIDLCESLEARLVLSPDYPHWNWTKEERKAYCNKNYYEYAFEHAKIDLPKQPSYIPEMFFDSEEEEFIIRIRKQFLGKKIIMWGLSGSSRQKTYPYVPYIVADILKEFKNVIIILVGGETCKILECGLPNHPRILKKSGEFSIRQSILMAKYSDLVISPDTGFLHGAGCWKTPKIGLLTHTTIENITKHFENDYSLESEAVCAPCFRLISEAGIQCPTEKLTEACICMSKDGMKPERVLEQIRKVLCN